MKPIYVGKVSKSAVEICKVIDIDVSTGNAIVFNRKTRNFEELTYDKIVKLHTNIRKLAEDTQGNDFEAIKFMKIEGNLYLIKIVSDKKHLTRYVDEKIYRAIVNGMKVM